MPAHMAQLGGRMSWVRAGFSPWLCKKIGGGCTLHVLYPNHIAVVALLWLLGHRVAAALSPFVHLLDGLVSEFGPVNSFHTTAVGLVPSAVWGTSLAAIAMGGRAGTVIR
jgi:hypothetical protein